jgi:mRNA interferase YafQ
MSLEIVPSSRFRRDLKKAISRGYNKSLLGKVVNALAAEKPLPPKNHDHALIGNFAGCRECHIAPDWLLIYEIDHGALLLYLTRTGTHADLF